MSSLSAAQLTQYRVHCPLLPLPPALPQGGAAIAGGERCSGDTAAASAHCQDSDTPLPSRVAVTALLLRAATVAPAGILPAHLPVACWRSALPATSACSPPPGHEAVSWCWEQRERERRGVVGPLCLIPWQAPPLHNAIELFRGVKRRSARPLGSPVPFSPALTVLLAGPIYRALPGLCPPLEQSHFRHPPALKLLSAGQSARVL